MTRITPICDDFLTPTLDIQHRHKAPWNTSPYKFKPCSNPRGLRTDPLTSADSLASGLFSDISHYMQPGPSQIPERMTSFQIFGTSGRFQWRKKIRGVHNNSGTTDLIKPEQWLKKKKNVSIATIENSLTASPWHPHEYHQCGWFTIGKWVSGAENIVPFSDLFFLFLLAPMLVWGIEHADIICVRPHMASTGCIGATHRCTCKYAMLCSENLFLLMSFLFDIGHIWKWSSLWQH